MQQQIYYDKRGVAWTHAYGNMYGRSKKAFYDIPVDKTMPTGKQYTVTGLTGILRHVDDITWS